MVACEQSIPALQGLVNFSFAVCGAGDCLLLPLLNFEDFNSHWEVWLVLLSNKVGFLLAHSRTPTRK